MATSLTFSNIYQSNVSHNFAALNVTVANAPINEPVAFEAVAVPTRASAANAATHAKTVKVIYTFTRKTDTVTFNFDGLKPDTEYIVQGKYGMVNTGVSGTIPAKKIVTLPSPKSMEAAGGAVALVLTLLLCALAIISAGKR